MFSASRRPPLVSATPPSTPVAPGGPDAAELPREGTGRSPRYARRTDGEPYASRGYTIVRVIETLLAPSRMTPSERSRWDVLETLQVPGAPPLVTRRKTCASKVSAEGWVDAYGEIADDNAPADAPARLAPQSRSSSPEHA